MNEHKHGDAYKAGMLRRMLAHETNACEEHYGAWLSHHDVSIKHLTIHQIESSEGIIFSDGRRTAGRKYWTDEVQAWLTHCEQRRRVPQFNFASGEKPLTRKLWARLGVSLRITAEEEAVIFGADETLSEETIRKIILDGRFTPDGDSYVPETAAEQFNEDYGTNHPVRDIGFEM